MKVVVNGQIRDVADVCSLEALLDQWQLANQRVVVERNGEIIDPSRYDVLLLDGDVVEIVRFVGGG